jgi:hypothetical protein
MSRRNSVAGAGASTNGGSATFSGDVTAARFLGSANNTAAAPTFLVEPAGNSGLYWDATNGVVISVDAVERMQFRTGGRCAVSSGVGATFPVLRLASTVAVSEWFFSTATPEAALTASPGAVSLDCTNGRLYLKRTGSGNTGWVQIDQCSSGTYTPTGTILTNLDSLTPGIAMYYRVGDIVTVAAPIQFDATAASAITFGLSLPIASNLAASTDLAGVGGSFTARATGDITNDRADCTVNNSLTTATGVTVVFAYRVL